MASLYEKDPRIGSRVEEILVADIDDTGYEKEAISRIEQILVCRLSGTTYEGPVISRIEKYLVEEEDISPLLSRIEKQIMEKDSYTGPYLSRIEWLIPQMAQDIWITFGIDLGDGIILVDENGNILLGRDPKKD